MAASIFPLHGVAARLQSDSLQSGTAQVLTPLFAQISASSSGNTTVVNATSGKIVRVLTYTVAAATNQVVTWNSSVSGAISGPLAMAANSSIAVPFSPVGAMQTVAGEGLIINLGNANSVGGHLTYVLT